MHLIHETNAQNLRQRKKYYTSVTSFRYAVGYCNIRKGLFTCVTAVFRLSLILHFMLNFFTSPEAPVLGCGSRLSTHLLYSLYWSGGHMQFEPTLHQDTYKAILLYML